MTATQMAATLLAGGSRTDLTSPPRARHGPPQRDLPNEATLVCAAAVRTRHKQLELRSFPTGEVLYRAPVINDPIFFEWRRGVLSCTEDVEGGCIATVVRQQEMPFQFDIPDPPGVVAASPGADCHLAVAARVSTKVYKLGDHALRYVMLRHADNSTGLAIDFPEKKSIFIGTRKGNVYSFDLRVGNRHVANVHPHGKRSSVVCLRASGDNRRLFVSSLLNPTGNLVCYDWRAAGRGAMTSFEGHSNSVKTLRFDVQEDVGGSGLLAAGGDDGIVRIWDAGAGGPPLADVDIPGDLATSIQFKGWGLRGNGLGKGPPGMWVTTDRAEYAVQVGV